MIDHVSIRVKDLGKSVAFYEPTLRAIGYKKLEGDFDGAVGFAVTGPKDDSGSVWLVQEGKGDPLTQNIHLAFAVADTDTVKKFYAAAIVAGGREHGVPAKCPEYGEHYYGAFVFDPDGNNVEATTYVGS
ncbi:MAG: VOC family protein [Candidatus Taylorbacteria bacterium]|nr:VOC family protein [Candidatus Taylorbacteria bacterium]